MDYFLFDFSGVQFHYTMNRYEKMSKKQQKIVNASKRGNWGNVKPITKVKASAKIYNRKKQQNSGDYGYSFGSSAFL